MATTIIGVDPHKRTHTAVVLDETEAIVSELRIEFDRTHTDPLLAWVGGWPERIWAVGTPTGSDGSSPRSWSAAARTS